MNDKQIERYLNSTATEADRREVEAWFEAKGEQLPQAYGGDESRMEEAQKRTLDLLQQRVSKQGKALPLRKRIYRYAAVASILLAVGATAYFAVQPKRAARQDARLYKNDIAPGHNQATLTLAGGKKIILTKGLSGLLAQQGQTQINVGQSNITYDAKNQTGDQLVYNTLSTARGEQSPYPLVLADGTKVWLNAESSITFPTVFNQKERIVKLTGEGYFEVAHNQKHPFKVQAANQIIEDIGTQFDVNAYTDEPGTRTTLVEGSVSVNNIVLKPGEQTDGKQIKAVDTKRYTAWKNGDFDFEDDNIQSVMRQLSRWYNIDVSYEGNITTEGLNAQITRNRNISSILHVLENTKGVHFKVEGRRVTVIE